MKKFCLVFSLLWTLLAANAQQYPPEWNRFTSGEYLYDIQSEQKNKDTSIADISDYLLNLARTNLAKQIEVRVKDQATLQKSSVNGKSNIVYNSQSDFLTEVNLKLVETQTLYDKSSNCVFAIAYINKPAATNYYDNEFSLLLNKIDNSIEVADKYKKDGFRNKSTEELNKAIELITQAETCLDWLNIFGLSQNMLNSMQGNLNDKVQILKSRLSELKHGILIYLDCKTDLFGQSYPALQNELKGILSQDGCSFTTNPAEADWIITINCTAREYNHVQMGNTNTYFTYVDAAIVIDKAITSQRIYEDEVSVKGGHTISFKEAARAGMKDLKAMIGSVLKENIMQ